MPSIRKLPSGKYNCQVRCKGIPAQSKAFTTYEKAFAWGKSREERVRTTEPILDTNITFRDMGLRYVATVLKGRPSRNEFLLRVERMTLHFPQPFTSITKWNVNDYKIMRLGQVSGTTCRDELLLLSRLFRWVKRELLIDIPNPCMDVAFPKASKPREKVVTDEEMKLLLRDIAKHSRTPLLPAAIELAYETAMRRSEILRLTPRCLQLEERLLTVVGGKTGDRLVPLTRRAVELLQESIERVSGMNGKLYPISAYAMSQAVRRARKRLGLSDDIRLHQLRHTRISLVARKGFNNAQIMAVSGHKDVRSVQRYTHLNARDVIDLLD